MGFQEKPTYEDSRADSLRAALKDNPGCIFGLLKSLVNWIRDDAAIRQFLKKNGRKSMFE